MVITQDGLRLETINILLQFIINLPLDDGIVLDKLHRYMQNRRYELHENQYKVKSLIKHMCQNY